MSDVIDDFLAGHGAYNHLSDDRLRLCARLLREFRASVGGPLEQATGQQLHDFLARQVDSGLSPNTVRKHLNAIRPFYKWAFKRGLIGGDKLMEIRMVDPPRGARANGKPNPYRGDEVQRFWRELHDRYPYARPGRGPNTPEQGDYWLARYEQGRSKWARPQPYCRRVQIEAIAWLALGGALRMDEIYRLELDDMTADGEYLVVRGAAKNEDAENRDRAVPWVTDDMRTAVEDWLELRERLAPPHERPWLCLINEFRFNPMNPKAFGMLMHDVGRGWEFRRMRHTAATSMLRAGYPLETVSKILGHARIQQTLEYAELVRSDLVAAADRSRVEVTKMLAAKS